MPTITETETVETPVDYVLPVWRKYGLNTFIKIYDTNKMLVVSNVTGKENIGVYPYPSLGINAIADTETIIESDFTDAYDAVILIIEAL